MIQQAADPLLSLHFSAIKNVRTSAQRPLPAPNRPADRIRAWQA
jgi:hypothetical protein